MATQPIEIENMNFKSYGTIRKNLIIHNNNNNNNNNNRDAVGLALYLE
jgi:hypothetical protein